MSPSAEQAEAAPAAEALVPARLLDDGEAVLLAVKPSGWFVLLASWPVVLVAAALGVAVYFAEGVLPAAHPAAMLVCTAAALLRLVLACLQWLGRVYVLTDKRILRIRGIARLDVVQCPLHKIDRTDLVATRGERFFALGTLTFLAEGLSADASAWVNLARPHDVKAVVDEAIHRGRLRRHPKPNAGTTNHPSA
ncbi:MAG: PH domain-containing protein [Planctomycetota bacterium]